MCKKIALSDTEWEEVEIAVQKMKLFEKKILPQFTIGYAHLVFKIRWKNLKNSVRYSSDSKKWAV